MSPAAASDKALDLLGRLDTSVLYQPFLERLNAILLACRGRGQDYVATSGLRTYAEQDDLYMRGRTKPGGIVTNAKAGFSPHNFGVAVDLAPHMSGRYTGKLDPGYGEQNYIVLGEEAQRFGMEWGGSWATFKDTPHVQLPLKSHGISWERMRGWYVEGGLSAVFAHLDVRGPW